jgi:hypothetical protein
LFKLEAQGRAGFLRLGNGVEIDFPVIQLAEKLSKRLAVTGEPKALTQRRIVLHLFGGFVNRRNQLRLGGDLARFLARGLKGASDERSERDNLYVIVLTDEPMDGGKSRVFEAGDAASAFPAEFYEQGCKRVGSGHHSIKAYPSLGHSGYQCIIG